MQKRGLVILTFALTALIFVIGVALYVNRPRAARPAPSEEAREGVSSRAPGPRVPRSIAAAEQPDAQPDSEEDGPPRIPRDKVEEFLQAHNRNASSLLAAFHALNDTNYLREAATNFASDPRVQWTLLARNIFPEERRKWIDLFKASSPDNSLANYFSAQEYFKKGETEAGVKEVLEANGKGQFKDYVTEGFLDEQELHLASGESALEAVHAHGWADDLLPQLPTLKDLGLKMSDLQKQYVASGDTASVENLAQAGLLLAQRLQTGDSGKYLLNMQVGWGMEWTAMSSLDPNTRYEFLDGKTPKERQEELKQSRTALKETLRESMGKYFSTMTDSETVSYSQRTHLYGELEAMKWLQQRRNAAVPKNGP